jgi:hypothetical protein
VTNCRKRALPKTDQYVDRAALLTHTGNVESRQKKKKKKKRTFRISSNNTVVGALNERERAVGRSASRLAVDYAALFGPTTIAMQGGI